MPPGTSLAITGQVDIEHVRRLVRAMAQTMGFDLADAEAIVLSVSELATNLLRYAQNGLILLGAIDDADRHGIRIESRDSGPGIENLDHALRDGFSKSPSIGSGIPSVRRLMDDFSIESTPSGTVIVAHKWIPDHYRSLERVARIQARPRTATPGWCTDSVTYTG